MVRHTFARQLDHDGRPRTRVVEEILPTPPWTCRDCGERTPAVHRAGDRCLRCAALADGKRS